MTEHMTEEERLCARCGQPAMGMAYIGENRYCHGTYDPGPTCYELAQRSSMTTENARRLIDLAAALRLRHDCDCDRCYDLYDEYEGSIYVIDGTLIGSPWLMVDLDYAVVPERWADLAHHVEGSKVKFPLRPKITGERPGDSVWFQKQIVVALYSAGFRLRRIEYEGHAHYAILAADGKHVGYVAPLKDDADPDPNRHANYIEPGEEDRA